MDSKSAVRLIMGKLSVFASHARARIRRQPWIEDTRVISEAGLFDRNYYLATYGDVAKSGMDPLEHYVRYGAAEGRNPSADFDTQLYLELNPDVRRSGINPLRHYCQFGREEGRQISPVQPTGSEKVGSSAADGSRRLASHNSETASRVILDSGIFDIDFYYARNPLLALRGEDPIQHYLTKGAKDLKDPSPYFSTEYYLSSNPDVAKSGMNPLVHFCRYGGKELRDPSPRFDMGRYWAKHLVGTEQVDVNPLTHYLKVGRREQLHAYGVGDVPHDEKVDLIERCSNALARGLPSELSALRLASVLSRLGSWSLAEQALRSALAFNWRNAKTHSRLADVLERQGKWWQAAEYLVNATTLDPMRATWFYRLGTMQERMGRYPLAADAYRRAISSVPSNSMWHYRLGYVLECAGDTDGARSSYAQATALDKSLGASRLGEGVFHEQREYWPEAARAYETRISESPLNPELWYRLGVARDRCMEWERACDAFRSAIALQPDAARWHCAFGLTLERLHRFEDAADAYGAAIALGVGDASYWHYRRGYVLRHCGRHEEACANFAQVRRQASLVDVLPEKYRAKLAFPEGIRSIGRPNLLDPQTHLMRGRQCELAGEWSHAAACYWEACRRQNKHDPDFYHRLGIVLWKAGRPIEACEAFLEMVVVRRPVGIDARRYMKSDHQRRLVHYNEYRECLPVTPRTILYESYGGRSISDNPLAVFEYVKSAPEFADWTHVWVVNEAAEIPEYFRTIPNIIVVLKNSDLYLRYLATASHLINNATFPSWFIRRPQQRYLNTWHGTPLKTLMKDIKGTFMERANSARNLLHCTHVISPNRHTSDVLIKGADIAGTFTGLIAETGYPRLDRLINSTEEERASLRAELGIQSAVPVVLYAPTWRGTFGSGEVEVDRILADLEGMSIDQCELLFRGHYSVAEKLKSLDIPVKVVPQRVDTCDLLAITDVLVTDYSSIFFDFLPTGRPIIFYAYDLEEYEEQRGLYFSMGELPGRVCTSVGQVAEAIRQALDSTVQHEMHSRALACFCPFEDGQATKRVVDFFFKDSSAFVTRRYERTQPSILMYVGAFPPQGITASALNLLGSLDHDSLSVTVAIDPGAVSSAQEKLERFSMMPRDVKVLARTGIVVADPEELWLRHLMTQRYCLPSERMIERYMDMYEKEFLRLFGGARFDAVVNFDGYSIFWTSLLAAAPNGVRKAIYMHSDMHAEMTIRFPNLLGVFAMLKKYDVLVSVSKQLCEVNRSNLSEAFQIPGDRFQCCENPIDVGRIRSKAEAPLDGDIAEWIKGKTSFLSLGRLSPEKDHAKLIRAFAAVRKSHPESVLVIIGDGPLRQDIEQLVSELGVTDAVLIGGPRSNPFPILAACDCLVMSSNHEGQPMVLLEAMTLGVPVVATDVDGNRDLLKPYGYGLLVDNSIDGMTVGLKSFLAGCVPAGHFDPEEHQRRAIHSFYREIVGRSPAVLLESPLSNGTEAFLHERDQDCD